MGSHSWDKYFDTTSEYWTKLQALYKANEHYPKKVIKGRNLHHKFLRSFSRAEGTEIDNDLDNLVSLGLGDHFLAHWLLWKCSNTGWKRYTSRAIHFMYKKSIKFINYEAAAIIANEWNEIEVDCKPSEETKRKMSETHKGKPSGMKGKKLSEETKRKLSEANKGKHSKLLSEETRKKMSESQKGKNLSKDTRQKISEATKGKNNPMYGKTHSEEARRKNSESHKGKVPWNKGRHWKLVDGKRVYY